MRKLTITPEQAAALANVPPDVTAHLAVKGERMKLPHPVTVPGSWTTKTHGIVPPADLAALVEQRCETCAGGARLIHTPPGAGPFLIACPECHDGKPLHTIHHEKAAGGLPCGRQRRQEAHAAHDWKLQATDDSPEIITERCPGHPSTVPGLWTYDALLPVFENYDGEGQQRVIAWTMRTPVEYFVPTGMTGPPDRITVYGTPEPGHYVLQLTRRSVIAQETT